MAALPKEWRSSSTASSFASGERERETGGVVSQEPLLSAEFSPRLCNRGDTQAHMQRTFSTLLANFKLELRTMV